MQPEAYDPVPDEPVDQEFEDALEAFWRESVFRARLNHMPTYFGPTPLEVVRPPAWSVGETEVDAEGFVDGLLTGTVTAIAGPASEYAGEPLPEAGELGIVVGGDGRPRVLVLVTEVESTAYAGVDPNTEVLSSGLQPADEVIVQRLRVLHSH